VIKMDSGFTITKAGWRLLAKLLAGSTLEITKVMVGSGKLAEGACPAELTDLIQPVALATSTVPVVTDEQVSFIVEYRSDLNGGLKEGFWLNEFGVFANDPDEGEILLYYATMGYYPQYVAAFNGSAVDVRRYPVVIGLTDTEIVELGYPAKAWVTSEELEAAINDLAADIIRGEVKTPLEDDSSNRLYTDDGKAIHAYAKLKY